MSEINYSFGKIKHSDLVHKVDLAKVVENLCQHGFTITSVIVDAD